MAKRKRILVVDDDRALLKSLGELLRLEGFDVETAADGRHALQLHDEHRFDVVLTDLFMDGVEGIETIAGFKKKSPGVRVIAMSGGGDVATGSYLGAARQVGADATLVKPFGIEQLKQAIEG
ncbi:MAG: response regulator [Betaproteobacteria bacterium]|nr:response regulator [Betaproteobacteria bacterium]MBV9362323.1 response regulator [Betaproteobacteria bacterium]